MFATDFLFDQHYASDFGLMICSFDQSPETASGGEIEYNTVKTPGRDRFSFYGAQRNTAIECISCSTSARKDMKIFFTTHASI